MQAPLILWGMTQVSTHSAPEQGDNRDLAAGRLAWYANRLRGMSAAEIAHRLVEQFKRGSAGRRSYGWSAFETGDGPVPRLPAQISSDIRGQKSLLADWRRGADATTYGHITLLGKTWPKSNAPGFWHLDPGSGRSWPQGDYCFRIHHRGMPGLGDVKYVWELNRLQHLPCIAALGAVEGSPAAGAHCLAQIESWIDANPPFKGVNWISGIELALRAISILTVLAFVEDGAIGPDLRAKIRACLSAHAYWLHRYPSKFSSANNHLIAEAAGLFAIGTLAPDLCYARRYAARGRALLIEEVERQIHDDGVGAEQTPTYTAFTLELYLLCIHLADRAGRPFPSEVTDRLALAGEHLRWITDAGANQPRIGDDDEGAVFRSQPGRESHYTSSVLGCLSALLDRPDLAPPENTPHLRNILLGAPAQAIPAPEGIRSFDTGGYTVVRRNIAGRDALLVLDHGPLGHLSIAAHGHADALALWLHLDDQPVLVDAGTYLYHSGGEWRDHFRGTAAHNTLSIAGTDSSTISGPFNWSHKADAWRTENGLPGQICRISAAHNGYKPGFGTTHHREVTIDGGRIAVTDWLEGGDFNEEQVELGFLFHPALDVEILRGTAIISRDGTKLVEILPNPFLELSVHRAETAPPRGWYSASFGNREPACQVRLRPKAPGRRRWTTEFLVSAP